MNVDDFLVPISEGNPCGPNLEYDPEYSVFFTKITNRSEVQYGDFVETPEPLNWSEIERECRRLLLRTKDIALLVILARCRTRLKGAIGFLEGMSVLCSVIKTYPDEINPQLMIEGELDIAVRANAMAMLIDAEGLLGDLREVVLSKSTGLRLQVRDVERSFAIPKHNDALAPESVLSQLQEMVFNDNPEILAILKALPIVNELLDWSAENLKEYTPDFSPLRKLLKLFDHPDLHAYSQNAQDENETDNPDSIQENEDVTVEHEYFTDESLPEQITEQPVEGHKNKRNSFSQDSRLGRKQALDSVKQARLWFEQYEPSSPVIVLLKQAEKMVGKRFSDLVQVIPLDLLMTWDGVDSENHEE